MAQRPVFIADPSMDCFVNVVNIDFEWYPGFSVKQKQRSIQSLHKNFNQKYKSMGVLEISSKSKNETGISLSAFNLMMKLENQTKCSVEVAFQSSKVFEEGGPYIDLLQRTSKEAKRDTRLKTSGKLLYFQHLHRKWPLEPKTLFYDWLYLQALSSHEMLCQQIVEYQAFTDIEFNPNKSINCQAKAAALFVSLQQLDLLDYVLASIQNYVEVCGKTM